MIQSTLRVVPALLLTALAAQARADLLIYDLAKHPLFKQATAGWPRDLTERDTRIVLDGKVVILDWATFTHRSGVQAHFALNEIRIERTPTPLQIVNKQFNIAAKDPEALMNAGLWGLKRGLLPAFYKAVDKVLEIEPGHLAASRVLELKKVLAQPCPENAETERKFRSIAGREKMRLEKSKHFLLLTDTDPEPPKGRKTNRARERLDMLEQVYESFLLLFQSQNVPLEIPKEQLLAVLFQNHDDFIEQAKRCSAVLDGAGGFYDAVGNVSYFDGGYKDTRYELLTKLAEKTREIMSADAKQSRDPEMIRSDKRFKFLLDIERENMDSTAISRTFSQQMAGNTGLVSREAPLPSWVRVGLAAYFEIPASAPWAGFGAVTEERLNSCRELARQDAARSDIDFIVGDELFATLQTPEDKLRGSVQAWTLTHYLMETHFHEFAAFCRLLGEQSANARLSPDTLKQLFGKTFGPDRKALDREWRDSMRALQSDMEILDSENKKP